MLQSHRHCVAFSALIREHWSELKAFTITEHFRRNEVIFGVGDPPNAIHLVESGHVKVSQLSSEGRENMIGIYQKGDLVGEVCICERGPRETQAVALEAMAVVSFRVNQLLKLLHHRPEMVFELLMIFCARVVECQEQVAGLAFDRQNESLPTIASES